MADMYVVTLEMEFSASVRFASTEKKDLESKWNAFTNKTGDIFLKILPPLLKTLKLLTLYGTCFISF